MKSKTSCFNRTIFKKNFTHYWPLWGLFFGYLLLIMPVQIWQMAASKWSETLDETARMYNIVDIILRMQIEPVQYFMFGCAAALAVFSYLYSPKNANMIHALPVNRLELYVTNFVSGLFFLIIPELIVFLISMLVCLANQITCVQYLFFGFLCQAGITFFAYSVGVFVAMFTGQIIAMPVYFVIVNYLYVGSLYLVSQLVGLINYGVSQVWNPGKSCILSPLYYLGNNLRSRVTYAGDTANTISGIQIRGMYLVALYAAAGVVFSLIAYQLYKRRQIETAGDWVSIGVVKPIFRWGVALCGGILLSVAFTDTLHSSVDINVYLCLIVCMVVVGFICFFLAEMLLEKNFRVFRKKRLIECAIFSAVAVLFITLFKMDAFGIEHRLPAEDKIEAAFVYMDFPVQVREEDFKTLLTLHRKVIDNKKEYLELSKKDKGYYFTTFRYYLKDGSVFDRQYALPVTEEYLFDSTQPSGQIYVWEKEHENLRREMFGVNYVFNEYISGSIDLYNEEGSSRNYVFSTEELEQILAAVEKDIDAGNYDNYYINCGAPEDVTPYMNAVWLDYYNRAGRYENWDYYRRYREYSGVNVRKGQVTAENFEVVSSGGMRFGTDCTNLTETLEQLGIVNDRWKLMTYEEYDKYSK